MGNTWCVCVYVCASEYTHCCVNSLSQSLQASAGADKVIRIWDGETNLHLHTFKGHKDTVSVSNVTSKYILVVYG